VTRPAAWKTRLRSLVGASVPEPIADGHWLRAAKGLGWASAALLVTDAMMAAGPWGASYGALAA
jgi:hypothetical protein